MVRPARADNNPRMTGGPTARAVEQNVSPLMGRRTTRSREKNAPFFRHKSPGDIWRQATVRLALSMNSSPCLSRKNRGLPANPAVYRHLKFVVLTLAAPQAPAARFPAERRS